MTTDKDITTAKWKASVLSLKLYLLGVHAIAKRYLHASRMHKLHCQVFVGFRVQALNPKPQTCKPPTALKDT